MAVVTTRLSASAVWLRRGLAHRLSAWPSLATVAALPSLIAWLSSYRALPAGQPSGRRLHVGPGRVASAPCCAQDVADRGATHSHRRRSAPLPSCHLSRCRARPLLLDPPNSPCARRRCVARRAAIALDHARAHLFGVVRANRRASPATLCHVRPTPCLDYSIQLCAFKSCCRC